MRLAELTSPRIGELDPTRTLLLLPVGSVEQHSYHLPVGTDSMIVTTVAERLEQHRPDELILAPTQWYGASSHHLGFPGTCSLEGQLVAELLSSVMSSLHMSTGFFRFLILNGHGGNEPAMRHALELLRSRVPESTGYAVSYWNPLFDAMSDTGEAVEGGMGHACEFETSMILSLRPELVNAARIEPDVPKPVEPWVFGSLGFDRLTSHGGIGDPTGATPEDGERFIRLTVDRLVAVVDRLLSQ